MPKAKFENFDSFRDKELILWLLGYVLFFIIEVGAYLYWQPEARFLFWIKFVVVLIPLFTAAFVLSIGAVILVGFCGVFFWESGLWWKKLLGVFFLALAGVGAIAILILLAEGRSADCWSGRWC